MLKRLTPVRVVDAVEPCAAFWEARMGFVALEKDGIELMYQARAAVPRAPAPTHDPTIQLFMEVDDLDAVERAMEGAIVLARHDTFYGMTELAVRDPAGTQVIFAQPSRPVTAG